MNTTTNSSAAGSLNPIMLAPWLRILESVGLIIVFVASLFLNSATCLIIARNRYLRRRPANVLVANLCVSNVVLTVFVIPFSLTSLFADRHRVYQGPACTANGFFSVASCGAIVITLCCISFDRYVAVCKPTRYRTILTTKRALIMILLTWALALLYGSFPVLGWSKYEYHPGTLHCSPAWTDGCSLYIFLSIVGFAIPVAIMVVTYIRIFIVIRKHSRKIANLQIASTKLPNDKAKASDHLKQVDKDAVAQNIIAENQTCQLQLPATPSKICFTGESVVMFTDTPRDPLGSTFGGSSYDVTGSCDIVEDGIPSNSPSPDLDLGFVNESHTSTLVPPPISKSNQRSLPTRRRLLGVLGQIQGSIRLEKRSDRRLPREYKVAKTGCLLLIVFLVLWLPYLVVHSCSTDVNAAEGVFHAAMWLVYMNGVVNPIAYAFNNSIVKARLKQICCKVCFICSICCDKPKRSNRFEEK